MSDGHDHGHDDETATDPRPRVRAIQSLLVEKGIVSTDAVDEAISAYERDIGPQNGARVVARAWTDPEFKRRLLADAEAALDSFDFDVGMQHIQVKENTDDVHNAVVCTLCSCYPWSLLGLPPTWYKTPSYRSRMVREPRSVLDEFGLELEEDVTVDVWDSSSEIRYMVLPQRPDGTAGYDEDELTDLVTRDAMIGVERLDASSSASTERVTDGGSDESEEPFAELLGLETEPTFAAPWQARAFGVTVALYENGSGFDWSAFQERLIDEVEATPADADGVDYGDADATERTYYEQWQAALERLLVTQTDLDTETVDARATEFASGERTAEEFVGGSRVH